MEISFRSYEGKVDNSTINFILLRLLECLRHTAYNVRLQVAL